MKPLQAFDLAAFVWLLALVALLVGCAPGKADPPVDPCESAANCGRACADDGACGAGLHCADDGTCAASCTPSGGECGSAAACDGAGRCVPVEGPIFDGSPPLSEAGSRCVHADVGFEELVPTVVFLVDKSGSMTEDFGGTSRWESLRTTLIDPASGVIPQVASKVRVGVTLYTSYDGTKGGACPLLTEVPPAADNAARIETMYAAAEITHQEDDTPTGESVQAVADSLARDPNAGAKAIVLATDGEPDTCADPDAHNDDTNARSVATVKAAFDRGITTYVISVGSDVGQKHLEDLARAGATNGTPYRALDTASLVSALDQIVRGVVTCDFQLSGTVQAGQESSGTVLLDGAPLAYRDPNGWELASSNTVRLLGDACHRAELQAGHLHIDFPCEAYVPIR